MAEKNKIIGMISKLRMGIGGNNSEGRTSVAIKSAQVSKNEEKKQISVPAADVNENTSVEDAFNRVLANWEEQRKNKKQQPQKQKINSKENKINAEAFDFSFSQPPLSENRTVVIAQAPADNQISTLICQLNEEKKKQESLDTKIVAPENLSEQEKNALAKLEEFIDDWVEKNLDE